MGFICSKSTMETMRKNFFLYVFYCGRWANAVWQTTGMDGLTFIKNNKHSKSQLFILINKLDLQLIKRNHKIVPWNDCVFLPNCYIKATFTKRSSHLTLKCYFRLLVKALTKINWNATQLLKTTLKYVLLFSTFMYLLYTTFTKEKAANIQINKKRTFLRIVSNIYS